MNPSKKTLKSKIPNWTIMFLLIGLAFLINGALPLNKVSVANNSLSLGQTRSGRNIIGSENPELIPDTLAYSIFFRFLSGAVDESERKSIIDYINQSDLKGIDVDLLLNVAQDFQKQVSVLDFQANVIKENNWPHPNNEAMAQLTQLQEQKERIVAETVNVMAARIGAQGMEKFRLHINERVKRRMKLSPTPDTPPGGPGWQHGLPKTTH